MNRKNSSPTPIVGIGWYSKDQWYKLRAVAADPESLEDTYEEWVEVFNRGTAVLKKSGINALKVPVDVDELEAWCREKGLPINGEARSQYVTEILSRADSR